MARPVRRDAGLGDRLPRRRQLRRPDRLRIVLDMSGRREDLRELRCADETRLPSFLKTIARLEVVP
jgi:hypothetical protein